MCGISGIIKDKISNSLSLNDEIKRMSLSLQHRGPDNHDVWVSFEDGVALGHQRLSILDLSSAGNQPMELDNSRFVISFNGEIYNHLKIRKRLENDTKRPYSWKSQSDTETLIRAFEAWGILQTLKRCEGMFSIAIWDKKRKNLTLARDRFGEKPLYFGWVNNHFVFASEIKAFKTLSYFRNTISKKALHYFLKVNYIPAPLSIYENLYKLEPGKFFEIDRSIKNISQINFNKFWSLDQVVKDGINENFTNESMYLDELENRLTNSVKSQMLSDAPLGSFLSGGTDSSLICALMQKENIRPIKTFTIGFKDKSFDESSHAKKVANILSTDHFELAISEKETQDVISYLPNIYDEPFADSSQIPTYLICKAAKQNVKVALSGDGGDEIFGGYNRYTWCPKIWNKISFLPYFLRKEIGNLSLNISEKLFDKILSKFINRPGFKIHKVGNSLINSNSLESFMQSMAMEWIGYKNLILNYSENGFENEFFYENNLKKTNLEFSEVISKMMYLDSVTYLQDDILCKLDRAAMSNSLETRVPFLDEKVVDLAWRIPISEKIKNGVGKWPLKKILSKYIPQNLIDRPKTGFSIPIGKWLRSPLRDWSENLLNEKKLKSQGYLSSSLIRKKWKEHLEGKQDHSSKLWSVLMFQAWLESQY